MNNKYSPPHQRDTTKDLPCQDEGTSNLKYSTERKFTPTGEPAPTLTKHAHEAIRRADRARAYMATKAKTHRIG